MTDPLDTIIIQALKACALRDADETRLIRDEIKNNGTWWAAEHIRDLRAQNKRLRAAERAGRANAHG
jgi:hypothetical protein